MINTHWKNPAIRIDITHRRTLLLHLFAVRKRIYRIIFICLNIFCARRTSSPYAYPGVQIVHPRLFAGAPEGAFSTNTMWDRAIVRGRLYGTRLDGVWIHVGTPEARDEAEAYLASLTYA